MESFASIGQDGAMDATDLPNGAVVVAVDGSEHADRAATWAADAAVRERRPLLLAHALGVPNPYTYSSAVVDAGALSTAIREAGDELVREAAERIRADHPDVDVRTLVEIGDARDLLVDLSEHAHLLVVGSRGRGPVRSLLLGSVAAAATRHAHCPVVVLRPNSDMSSGGGVLVGIDGTESSVPTLEFAFRAASWRDAPLTVVYCFWESGRSSEDPILVAADDPDYEDERLLVGEIVAGLREKYPDVEVRVDLARGFVDRILVELSHGRDLAVVGARSRGALTEALLGSVATTMVEYAPCPVAVVPHEKA